MKNNWVLIVFVLVIIVAIAGYLIFKNPNMTNPSGNTVTGSNPNNNTPATTTPTSSGGNSNGNTMVTTPVTDHVKIQNFAFSPSTITVHKGDIIIWTNMDSTTHTVTSDSGSELASGNIPSGQSFSHTFNTAGTFNYHCAIHTGMKGTVVVQ
jgi:plastocyanin